MSDESRRVLISLLQSARREHRSQEWEPLADVYRTGWGWIVKFDLAGVRPEDFSVTISKDSLTVEGIRRDMLIEEGATCYCMEISYSRFRRSLQIPGVISTCRSEWEFRDGMLIVRLRNSAA